MSAPSPSLEQRVQAQDLMIGQLTAALMGLAHAIDKLAPLPHAALAVDSKGSVKPDVKIYHQNPLIAAAVAEFIFDRLDRKYGGTGEVRGVVMPLPVDADPEMAKLLEALRDQGVAF